MQAVRLGKRAAALLLQSTQAKKQAAALAGPAYFAQSSKLQRKALAFEKAAEKVTAEQVGTA